MPNIKNQETVSKITDELGQIQAMWVVDYRGLTVKESHELRQKIRDAGAEMKVYKNTLMRLALGQAELPDMGTVLEGPSAFVFCNEDPVASAKAIKEFAKGNENLQVKGGIMDGAFVDETQVKAIADLPSREELIAKLLGTISNPLVQTVRVLNAPMEAFARAVNQIAETKPAA